MHAKLARERRHCESWFRPDSVEEGSPSLILQKRRWGLPCHFAYLPTSRGGGSFPLRPTWNASRCKMDDINVLPET